MFHTSFIMDSRFFARLISDSDTHRIGESISFSISEEKTYLFRHPGGEALRPA